MAGGECKLRWQSGVSLKGGGGYGGNALGKSISTYLACLIFDILETPLMDGQDCDLVIVSLCSGHLVIP